MINLGPQPDLRSERLWLTPFAAEDAPAVFDYARNPRVAEHTTWRPHQSVTDAVGFIELVHRYPSTHCWALRLIKGGPARGAIEFGVEDSSTGSVHYVLAEELWNQGFMTEAVRVVLGWAFATLSPLERVTTTATPGNVGSRRVLEKCGFEFSGIVVQDFRKFGGPIEMASYALTRGRWEGRDGI
jgi:RimJ/RimL family protein N-acetyltransferase